MTILLLASLTEATGNATTARRIARGLEPEHRVLLLDPSTLKLGELRQRVQSERIDLCIALHALLVGPFARALAKPYILILGGTDLYQDMHELQRNQMRSAAQGARFLVAFSRENLARARDLWPESTDKLRLIPQGVDVSRRENQTFDFRRSLGLAPSAKIILTVTGIRRGKDPLFLVDELEALAVRDPSICSVFLGPVLEEDYARIFFEKIKPLKSVRYVGALPRAETLTAIEQSDVLLNTSLVEGMCGAILEAWSLKTPVVARKNEGNLSLIQDQRTGFLFEKPDEAISRLEAILTSSATREMLSSIASAEINKWYSSEIEVSSYRKLINEMIPGG